MKSPELMENFRPHLDRLLNQIARTGQTATESDIYLDSLSDLDLAKLCMVLNCTVQMGEAFIKHIYKKADARPKLDELIQLSPEELHGLQ